MQNEIETNGYSDISAERFEEIEIPVPWGHIKGKWWGPKTKQPILAIHGWQDNCGSFDNLAPLLSSKKYAVLAIDLPGHGFSSHLPAGQMYYIFWDGIHFVKRIVNFFGWKKLVILGHSLGGAIAYLYAAIFKEDVSSIIQIDISCPPVFSIERMEKIQVHALNNFFKYDEMKNQTKYDFDEILDLLLKAHNGSLSRESGEIMLKRGKIADKTKANCYMLTRDPKLKTSVLANFTKDQVLEYASRVRCKVLNIRAVPGYLFEKPEMYEAVLDEMEKNCEVVRVKRNGTHHLHLNTPEVIIDDILDFLS